MTDLIKQIEELNLRCDSSTLLPVILQVEQLTKERDEARRMYCEAGIITGQKCEVQAHYISTSLGWDCYDKKKETL